MTNKTLQKHLQDYVHTGKYAQLAGIHKQTVIQRINNGKLDCIMIDGVYFIKKP